jgi:hypothetical protein
VRAEYVVVGGGPCGAIAAAAAAQFGKSVIVIDAGCALDDARKSAIAKLSMQLPEEWDAATLSTVSHRAQPGDGLGQKLWFGSDLPYRPPAGLSIDNDGVGTCLGFSQGGLSSVWGATMLPYAAEDIMAWPREVRDDLPAAYAQVSQRVPVSGRSDPLEPYYPFHGPRLPALRLSSVAAHIYERSLATERQNSRRPNAVTGQARLALRSGQSAPWLGCVYCARCLEGCVYGHIWSSDQLLNTLQQSSRVRVIRGYVMSISEDGPKVRADVELADSTGRLRIEGQRLFVAAGAVGTAALLQRSRLANGPVLLSDSQTTFLPMALLAGPAASDAEPSYSLSQLFVRLPSTDARDTSQLQLYTYNYTLPERARVTNRLVGRIPLPVVKALMRRVVVGIGYLSSGNSGKIEVRSLNAGRTLQLRPVGWEEARESVRAWMRGLYRYLLPLDLFPVPALADITLPGGGFHIGASLPMCQGSGSQMMSSDQLGRPFGMQLTHVVDSSVLPTIPAGPITYTAMANAWRIVARSVTLPLQAAEGTHHSEQAAR